MSTLQQLSIRQGASTWVRRLVPLLFQASISKASMFSRRQGPFLEGRVHSARSPIPSRPLVLEGWHPSSSQPKSLISSPPHVRPRPATSSLFVSSCYQPPTSSLPPPFTFFALSAPFDTVCLTSVLPLSIFLPLEIFCLNLTSHTTPFMKPSRPTHGCEHTRLVGTVLGTIFLWLLLFSLLTMNFTSPCLSAMALFLRAMNIAWKPQPLNGKGRCLTTLQLAFALLALVSSYSLMEWPLCSFPSPLETLPLPLLQLTHEGGHCAPLKAPSSSSQQPLSTRVTHTPLPLV